MQGQDMTGIPFTGFPLKRPQMQIGRPEQTEYPAAEHESEFCCDTQTWD